MKTDEENIAAIQRHVREYQEREAMVTTTDNEPITLEWLKSIKRTVNNSYSILVRVGEQWIILPKGITRGDFRTLVRILEGDKI